MPIVINEIEIAVEVTQQNGTAAGGGSIAAVSHEEIVKECVEKVMEILHQKNER